MIEIKRCQMNYTRVRTRNQIIGVIVIVIYVHGCNLLSRHVFYTNIRVYM